MMSELATDKLRQMLDERGVEWTAPNSCLRDEITNGVARGFYYEAFEVPEPDGTFLLTAAHQDDLTPEQAIAATLGGGKLTAEQVRKAISIGGVWDEDSAMYYVSRTDMQAIANELNATLNDNETVSIASEINPCPFCGGKADLVKMETKCDGMKFGKVSCNNCHCMGANIHMWHKTESEAIKFWNAARH